MSATPIIEGVLTANYADNLAKDDTSRQAQSLLYIDYTKGSEAFVLLFVEFSYREAPDEFYPYCFVNNSSGDVLLTAYELKIAASGRYRVPVPLSIIEDWIRVSIKADTPGGAPGTVKIYHHFSTHQAPHGVISRL